ncbi:RICIN domain-containing protein [Arenicella sp.]|nr:RICIN domain-containing protein [Arenicella sp.]
MTVAATPFEDSNNRVEIKLIAPLDETRGWCVDLFAHLANALPLGGFQGHNCFLYLGKGVTEDQGFDFDLFKKTGELRLVYFDVCMTLYTPDSGSFIAAESCSGEDMQRFEMSDLGEIRPMAAPELCLTLGDLSVPGGGRLAPIGARPPATNEGIHLIRRLTFTSCNDDNATLQQWSFRSDYMPEEATQQSRFLKGG